MPVTMLARCRRPRPALLPVLTLALTPLLASAERLTPERVFASPDLSGEFAREVQLAPDGSAVTWLASRSTDVTTTDLWILELPRGKPRLLVDGLVRGPARVQMSAEEKSRRERAGTQTHGVVDYAWDDDGRSLVVPVEGRLWLHERGRPELRELTGAGAGALDVKLSPHGHAVSFVRDGNLWVLPVTGGPARALTTAGTALRPWATAEFIAQEELGRPTGYWWGPDERRIALTHVDQGQVDVVDRLEVDAGGTHVVPERYPRAGTRNARVTLEVMDVGGGTRTRMDLGSEADMYLARVDWSVDGRTLYVQRLTRDQRRLDLLALDPATGRARVLLTETSPHWVELGDDLRPLRDGRFLWSSERSGNRHLYLYAADGTLLRQLTRGDWPVDRLEGVDERHGIAWFGASLRNPTGRQIYAVSLDHPAEPQALSRGEGWWTAVFARHAAVYAGSYEDPATPPQTAVFDARGERLAWIAANTLDASHPFHPYLAPGSLPKFGTLTADDGEALWWSLRTPPEFDPQRQYPVIVEVYGGPAAALVQRRWQPPADQLLLEAGYVLFRLDNRGTPNRSVAFKTAIDRHLGQLEVVDQLKGVAYLRSLPFVDPARIGVTGWSNGGYMTLQLLTVPDSPYRAGVAGAPVTDWRLYDTAYTERYMGTPADNASGYQQSDVLPRVANLRPGSLLLVHGMADDNVTFDHSLRLLAALQSEPRLFETMVYPGLRHRAGWTPQNKTHRLLMTLDFFARTLRPELPMKTRTEARAGADAAR